MPTYELMEALNLFTELNDTLVTMDSCSEASLL